MFVGRAGGEAVTRHLADVIGGLRLRLRSALQCSFSIASVTRAL